MTKNRFLRRVLSSVLILFQLLSIAPAWAQEPQTFIMSQPPQDAGRAGGSSFGTSQEKKPDLPQQPQPGTGMPMMMGPDGMLMQMGTLNYQVHILGEVMRPGTYRISASTRASEAIQQAGGILERGSERRIQLRRVGGGRNIDLVSFKLLGNLDANPYLLDNDVIYVPLKSGVVQIEGTVKRPGVYELRSERTMEDVVRLAGGFTPGIEGQGIVKVVRFRNGMKELLDVENTKEARSRFRIENADVVIFPHFLTSKKAFDYNIAKLPGDNKLFYPSYEERVFVLGAVNRPGPYLFNPYYDVRQYLTVAGGTSKLAKVKKIKIITADGRTIRATNVSEINPGDTIVVPEKYMAPESFATLVIGITASVVGITSAIVTLAK